MGPLFTPLGWDHLSKGALRFATIHFASQVSEVVEDRAVRYQQAQRLPSCPNRLGGILLWGSICSTHDNKNHSIQSWVLHRETGFEFPRLFYRSSPRAARNVPRHAETTACASSPVAPIENQWPYLPGRPFHSFQRPWEFPQWSLCQMNQENLKMRRSLHCNHLLQSTVKLPHLRMRSPPSGLPSVLSHPDIPYDQYMVFLTHGHSGPRS